MKIHAAGDYLLTVLVIFRKRKYLQLSLMILYILKCLKK